MATTHYIWDPVHDSYLMETDGAGNTTAVYTNEPTQFGGLISQRRGNQTSYYHFDALGSTRALTDSAETVTDTNLYDAWGVNLTSTGTTENPFRFVGRFGYHTDADTESLYILRRVYQPTLARWWSVDPVRFSDSLNSYMYSCSSPANVADPSGTSILVFAFEGFGGFPKTFAAGTDKDPGPRLIFPLSVSLPIVGHWFRNAVLSSTPLGKNVKWRYYAQNHVSFAVADAVKMAPLVTGRGIANGCPYYDSLVIVGYSNGGHAALQMAQALFDRGIRVDAAVTVDPVPKGFTGFSKTGSMPISRPLNVSYWYNVYQTSDRNSLGGLKRIWGRQVQGADINEVATPLNFILGGVTRFDKAHIDIGLLSSVQRNLVSVVYSVSNYRKSWRYEIPFQPTYELHHIDELFNIP